MGRGARHTGAVSQDRNGAEGCAGGATISSRPAWAPRTAASGRRERRSRGARVFTRGYSPADADCNLRRPHGGATASGHARDGRAERAFARGARRQTVRRRRRPRRSIRREVARRNRGRRRKRDVRVRARTGMGRRHAALRRRAGWRRRGRRTGRDGRVRPGDPREGRRRERTGGAGTHGGEPGARRQPRGVHEVGVQAAEPEHAQQQRRHDPPEREVEQAT